MVSQWHKGQKGPILQVFTFLFFWVIDKPLEAYQEVSKGNIKLNFFQIPSRIGLKATEGWVARLLDPPFLP